MSLELVLAVPVLVLLALFVLWAGRGGRAGLSADLAAEEAVSAAALCCTEGSGGATAREAIAESVLASHPDLGFLCVGGPLPDAPADGGQIGSQFIEEQWLGFGGAAHSGGVGVLGLRLACETDGAVAPLRGLFPTVTVRGAASEVVHRRPRAAGVGFSSDTFAAVEGQDLTFEVTNEPPATSDITVEYTINSSGGADSATAGIDAAACEPGPGGGGGTGDYVTPATPHEITIGANEGSATIVISTCDGDWYEGDEVLSLVIIKAEDSGGTDHLDPNRADALGQITENDPRPHLWLKPGSASVAEGGSVDFKVRLMDSAGHHAARSDQPITVDIKTMDGTDPDPDLRAMAGLDYTPISTTHTFNPGDDTHTVTVQAIDDASSPAGESDEWFTLGLENPGGDASLSTSGAQAKITISDDEARVTVADASVLEGETLTFSLNLDRDILADITVNYSLVVHQTAAHGAQAGTACDPAADDDYVTITGSMVIERSDGRRVSLPAITTCEDLLVEHDETFWLEISIPTNGGEAVVPDGEGAVGTIVDDDTPTVTITADPADAAGDEGQDSPLKFTVGLTVDGSPARLDDDVVVSYSISGSGAFPATAGADYTMSLDSATPTELSPTPTGLSGTLTFAKGPSAAAPHVFEAALLADSLSEQNETFVLDFDIPAASFANAVFADPDSDPDTDDSVVEATIRDASASLLFINNATAREGETMWFTVLLCNPVDGQDVTVDFRTEDRSATGGARHPYPDDYAPRHGTLTFPASMASQPVDEGCGTDETVDAKSLGVGVEILRDDQEESDKEFHMVLSGPTPVGVGVGKAIGVGRIRSVSKPTVRVSSPTATEGNPLAFVISLEDNDGSLAVDSGSVTVVYETADITAEAGDSCGGASADYVALGPTEFRFERGSSVRTHTVAVTTCDDMRDERNETLGLVVGFVARRPDAFLGDSEGTGTVIDGFESAVRITDAVAEEGDTAVFVVIHGHHGADGRFVESPAAADVTVRADTEDGTATGGPSTSPDADYTPSSESLTIREGSSRVEFRVPTLRDGEGEPAETFRAVLSVGSSGLYLDRGVAIGTIAEKCFGASDPASAAPRILVREGLELAEGASAFLNANMRFELSHPLCASVQMGLEFVSGTAIVGSGADADIRAFTGRLTVTPAQSTSLIGHWVPAPVDDAVHEGDEQFTVRVFWDDVGDINNAPSGSATVTILDNDPEPSLRIADAAVREGQPAVFAVTLDAPSSLQVNAQYRTVERRGAGAATAGDDYVPQSSWAPIAIDAGDTSATVTVPTVPDSVADGDETFLVELRAPASASTPLNARLDKAVAVGTILAAAAPTLSILDATAAEGHSAAFRVELSAAQTQPVTVEYRTIELTAPNAADEGDGATGDYARAEGTLTFAPGDTFKSVSVALRSDGVDEGDEIFQVELDSQSPQSVSLADPLAVGTISGSIECVDPADADAVLPSVGVVAAEAAEDAGDLSFGLTLQPALCSPAVVGASTSGGTALAGVDYRPLYCESFWRAWQTEGSCTVALIDDIIAEGDETIRVTPFYRTPAATWIHGDEALAVTITDDDVVSLSVAVVGDRQGADEGESVQFAVRLDRPSTSIVTVGFATEEALPVSATADADYESRSGTVEIAAGELSGSLTVLTLDDTLDEEHETFSVRLSNPSVGAQIDPAAASAEATIYDDDVFWPAVRVSDASALEGEQLVFEVTLDQPTHRRVVVPVVVADGSATVADGDYTEFAATTAEFAPGVTYRVVTVQTLSDTELESDENLWVRLGRPVGGNASIGDGLGEGVIRDGSERRLTVSDATVSEGGALRFEVGFLDLASGRDVTVRYRTRAGTATAGDDYDSGLEGSTRELTIPAGDRSATVLVDTAQDSLDEENETLVLVLSDPDGAVIAKGSAPGVIVDDDPAPGLRVADVEVVEGAGVTAAFVVSLSEASGRNVRIAYRTVDATAAAGADYTALDSGATITAGRTRHTVEVPILDDSTSEAIEAFRLEVTSAVNAQRDDAVGVATVVDDDRLRQILLDDPADAYESDGAVTFTVRLSSADNARPVTVTYSTVDGTAAAPADYTAAASQTLTFRAGQTSATVSVPLIDDIIVESAETFGLQLSAASSNAEIGVGRATALILDDDDLPTVSVADATDAAEGTGAVFAINLSRPVARDVTVDYATIKDLGARYATAATSGTDFAATEGTVTIAARTVTAPVTVPLLDDPFDENDETFWLQLSSPAGARLLGAFATATIIDDDPLPVLSVSDATAVEGTLMSIVARLDRPSGRTVRVPWTTHALQASPSAASPGADYIPTSDVFYFSPYDLGHGVWVKSLPDAISENHEIFHIRLGTPVNAVVDDRVAVGTIEDDDGLPLISIADATVTEGDGPAVFEVTLRPPSSRPVTVSYETDDRTAVDPDDYAPDEVKTLTIGAGETSATITVFVEDDSVREDAETFAITLTSPTNAEIAQGKGTATGTILEDDDELPWVSVIGDHVSEGDGVVDFSVTLSRASADDITVRWTTADSSPDDSRDVTDLGNPDRIQNVGAAGHDYIAAADELIIPAGETTAIIPVTLIDDDVSEGLEGFQLLILGATGARTGGVVGGYPRHRARATIEDDDGRPILTFGHDESHLGAGNTLHYREDAGTMAIELKLSRSSDATVVTVLRATNLYPLGYRADQSVPQFLESMQRNCPALTETERRVVFSPGETSQTLRVGITGDPGVCQWTHRPPDGAYNDSRGRLGRLSMTLEDTENAILDWENAVVHVAIYDVQQPPDVGVFSGLGGAGNRSVAEAVGAAEFTFLSSYPFGHDIDVAWVFADGTAVAGADFENPPNKTITIPAHQTAARLSLGIIDDAIPEATERFGIRIAGANSGGQNFLRPIPSAYLDIIDNDGVRLQIADVEVSEGVGTASAVLTLTNPATGEVRVDYATGHWSPHAGDGPTSATAPDDYAAASGTVVFAPGEVARTLDVSISDDDVMEGDERFTITLSGLSGATLENTGVSTVTIQDDDGDDSLPVLTLVDTVISESGAVRPNYLLSGPSSGTVTFEYSIVLAPELGHHAADAADFTDWPPRPATQALDFRIDGERPSRTVVRRGTGILDDETAEPNERYMLVLLGADNAVVGKQFSWITISDDDRLAASVGNVRVPESADAAVFTVTLNAPAAKGISIDYTTVPARFAFPALPDEDYVTVSGTVEIPVGATSVDVPVPLIDDTVDEYDETFLLVLSSDGPVNFDDRIGTATIVDDEDGIWWASDRSVWEDAGSMSIELIRDNPSSPVTVSYTVRGVSAVGGAACTDSEGNWIADYITPSGTVTMPAASGERLGYVFVTIEVCDDDEEESIEKLLIELTGVTGRKTTAVGTIVDDDVTGDDAIDDDAIAVPFIHVGDSPDHPESRHAADGAQFQIMADGVLTGPVTVSWQTEDCTASDASCPAPATAGADYTANSGSVTLTPDDPTATVTVAVIDDWVTEGDEQFFVRITGVTGPAAPGTVGIGRIAAEAEVELTCVDPSDASHPPPTLTVSVGELTENSALLAVMGLVGVPFCDGASVAIGFWSSNGTASDLDHDMEDWTQARPRTYFLTATQVTALNAGTLTLQPGYINGDGAIEDDEYFTVLANWFYSMDARYYNATPVQATATIKGDS